MSHETHTFYQKLTEHKRRYKELLKGLFVSTYIYFVAGLTG